MNQFKLFNQKNLQLQHIALRDGSLIYKPNLFEDKKATNYFNLLKDTIRWEQKSLKMYGKIIPFPRLMAWYGDRKSNYSFSGHQFSPQPWTKELLEIKLVVEQLASQNFNSVLLNYYRNGNDSMSWHADNEKELGTNPAIASVNFGETRKFQLKHNITKERFDLLLEHGSVLIMKGKTQDFWQHQLPKTKKYNNERINLTFRRIMS